MLKKPGRSGIVAVLTVIALSAIVWAVFCCTEVGMAKVIGVQESRLSGDEYADMPQSIIDDAGELAKEVIGSGTDRFQDFVAQVLTTYTEAKESDVVIIFNSGGWGWNLIEESPGWSSIMDGIKSQLENLGYRSLVLNYRRTGSGLRSVINEFIEAANRYPSKAKESARRVEFLTDHIPDLKVIIAGESTGTVLTDCTMYLLRDNPRVFSIQTGTPFWHRPVASDRTLMMNSNGKNIDTFSYGNVSAVLWATVKSRLGLLSPEENPGTVLSWLRAPGHHYSWQYPGVSSEVVRFLKENFQVKS